MKVMGYSLGARLRQFAVESMPNLEVIDLPAGHAINIEAADEFNQAVTNFLGIDRDISGNSTESQ